MRQAVLLGSAGTKRTDFFQQAAAQAGLPVLFVDWSSPEQWERQPDQTQWMMKIDPPLWDSCFLGQLGQLTHDYQEKLRRLSAAAKDHPLEFFNHPSAILELLDKRVCKKRLEQEMLAVTELLSGDKQDIRTAAQLLETMRAEHIYQVFLKPVSGSGAAGVSALRFQPSTGRLVLYTCALLHPQLGLVNTKCLRRFCGRDEVMDYIEHILALDCVIERWYAKAEHEGCSYDLRAVVLDGRLQFVLGRLSKGPITNLHLNNHPLSAKQLGLPERVLQEVRLLCRQAASCFPGLRIAGIDLLLEKGSLRPRIIEMNAQGDLIYQDIFQDNRIYIEQARVMREWVEG